MVDEQDSTCSLSSIITIFSKALGTSFSHTRNIRLPDHFLRKHVPKSPMKLFRYWSHASWVTIYETLIKNFCQSVQKHCREREKEKQVYAKDFCLTSKRKKMKGCLLSLFGLSCVLCFSFLFLFFRCFSSVSCYVKHFYYFLADLHLFNEDFFLVFNRKSFQYLKEPLVKTFVRKVSI